MNIDSLTIGQAKQISNMVSGSEKTSHPHFDGPVVAQFIGRFVLICNLEIKDGYCYLTNVRNVRYWAKRENGLGDVALHGPVSDDNIDKWPDQIIPLDKLGPVMSASKEHWT